MAWLPIETAPQEAGDFFLVRPKNTHPKFTRVFIPTVVQRIDGKFYLPDNEIASIYFGQDEPDSHPLKTILEWHPIPGDD